MRAMLTAAFVVAASPALFAGSVDVGINTLNGGTKYGTCHVTTFAGPADAVASYEKRQKERFEPVDPDVVKALQTGVSVSATVVTYKRPECAQNSGRPEKVVLSVHGGVEPVLVVQLKQEEVELKNMLGATFTAVNAHGTVPAEEIQKLVGKEFDFHLVYSDHGYKDKWKKDYAAKVLK
jgi:hypothetical protein